MSHDLPFGGIFGLSCCFLNCFCPFTGKIDPKTYLKWHREPSYLQKMTLWPCQSILSHPQHTPHTPLHLIVSNLHFWLLFCSPSKQQKNSENFFLFFLYFPLTLINGFSIAPALRECIFFEKKIAKHKKNWKSILHSIIDCFGGAWRCAGLVWTFSNFQGSRANWEVI